MKKYFSTIILSFIGNLWMAVTAQTISGKVVSAEQPVDGATVVLQTPDSVFIDAVITEADGNFTLNTQPEKYRLIIQHILYETFEHEGSGNNVGTLRLKAKDYALGEVVVKGERPLVKVESGKLTYDMPQLTANRLVTNVYEAIKQLPGVIERDETLTLAGSGAVSLILNGKPSSMTYEQIVTLLKTMPASRVERAEVMYSAPPQYHVRGAAINILLKGYKTGEGGLQGEINGEYEQKNEAGGGGNVTLAYTSSKFDWDVMYGVSNGYSRQDMDMTARHTVKDKVYDMEVGEIGYGRGTKHNLRAGGTYKFDDKNQLSLSYTSSLKPKGDNTIVGESTLSASVNDEDSKSQMHNGALNYTSGFGLSAGADYTYFHSKSVQSYRDRTPEGAGTAFNSTSTQNIDRWKIYADQSHTLPEAWTLNYGAAFTYVSDHNRQIYDVKDMEGENSRSNIGEYTYNIYAGFSKAFNDRWNLSASAAVEYYKIMDYKKWAVYPTLELNYVASPEHVLQLSFSSDKTYPGYWTLSGSVSHLNAYQIHVGNPLLRPHATYSGALTYILKSKYIFQASYDYMPDYFEQMIYLDSNELQSVVNERNWDYVKQFTLTAMIPFKIGSWWDSQLSLNLFHRRDKASDYFDAPFDMKKWTGTGNWTNTFTLSRKPDIRMEVSAFGQTKGIQGSYEIKPVGTVNAALRYTFANKKAMIQIKGNDLVNGFNHLTTQVRNGLQYIDMNVANYQRSLTVSFNYKFGGFKEKKTKGVDTSRFGM